MTHIGKRLITGTCNCVEFNLSFVIIYRNIYDGSIVMLLLIWKIQHLSYFNHSFHLNFNFTNHNLATQIFYWLPCCHKGTENHKEHCSLHLKGCLWPKNHYSQFRSYVEELLFSVQYLDLTYMYLIWLWDQYTMEFMQRKNTWNQSQVSWQCAVF